MIKTCQWCGKRYTATASHQKYCCRKCYAASQREKEFLRDFEKKKEKIEFHEYQAWDPKDPECVETYRFMRTIKPLNWGEIL